MFACFAGLPIYAMSIGVVSLAGNTPEVVAGVIYNPTLGEMLSAVKGRGCYLNNKRIKSKTDTDNTRQKPRESVLGESLINIGFPISKESTLLASSRGVLLLQNTANVPLHRPAGTPNLMTAETDSCTKSLSTSCKS